jgi:hypothetical protein
MAKKVQTTQLKGLFDINTMEIEETTKDDVKVYSLLEVLQEYADKTISINIKEEVELNPIEVD